MRYGIVINLDYENHPYQTVRAVFAGVRDQMLAAGFRLDGRVFTIDLPEDEACELARTVVETVEAEHLHEESTYRYIKEFYGFNFSEAQNLLLPPTEQIGVEELPNLEDISVIRFPGH